MLGIGGSGIEMKMNIAFKLILSSIIYEYIYSLKQSGLLLTRKNNIATRVYSMTRLKGLRSATSSEQILNNGQFTSSGKWTVESLHNGIRLYDYLNIIDPIFFSSSTASKKAIRKGKHTVGSRSVV